MRSQALQNTFLTTTGLFGNTLNCSTTGGIKYCLVFPGDETFAAVIHFFFFRRTSCRIANPEYEPGDMVKVVLHALASS
jgi:hypothetical protein